MNTNDPSTILDQQAHTNYMITHKIDIRGIRINLPASCDFPTRLRKKIKALGGSYTDVRGHKSHRYIRIPWHRHPVQAEAVHDIIIDLCRLNRRHTETTSEPLGRKMPFVFMIHGHGNIPAWVAVQYARTFAEAKYLLVRAFENAIKLGAIKLTPPEFNRVMRTEPTLR